MTAMDNVEFNICAREIRQSNSMVKLRQTDAVDTKIVLRAHVRFYKKWHIPLGQ